METFNEKKEKVAHNQFSIFAVGYGNFGGKRSSESAVPTLNPPKRSPDASVQQKTSEDQVTCSAHPAISHSSHLLLKSRVATYISHWLKVQSRWFKN